MTSEIINFWNALEQSLFEAVVQPALHALGMAAFIEDAHLAVTWFLLGLVQLGVMLMVLRPLEKYFPAEQHAAALSSTRNQAIRVDMVYTLLHRLGVFRLVLFFSLSPLLTDALGWLRVWGWPAWQLDSAIELVVESVIPSLTAEWAMPALLSLLLYVLAFDFLDYWLHRAQHHFHAWWALHAVHHSQRHMTLWSDNRNHVLDDVLRDVLLTVFAFAIGVAPAQFVAIVIVTQLLESLQHANVRWRFGDLGRYVLVSPQFHRLHHGVGVGHEYEVSTKSSTQKQVLGGHNFGVLFPWWDMAFGTARWDEKIYSTGIRDQVEQGRDYGQGFWAQQRLGLQRLVHSFKPR